DGEAEGGPAELTTEQRYRRRVVAKVRVEVRDALLAKPADQDRGHRQVPQVAQEAALRPPPHGKRGEEGTGECPRTLERLSDQGRCVRHDARREDRPRSVMLLAVCLGGEGPKIVHLGISYHRHPNRGTGFEGRIHRTVTTPDPSWRPASPPGLRWRGACP